MDYIRKDVYHPSKNSSRFVKVIDSISDLSNKVIESPIYPSLLKNLIEIDFFLIKAEVDRANKVLTKYGDIKNVYINAILSQNQKLTGSLNKIKKFLE